MQQLQNIAIIGKINGNCHEILLNQNQRNLVMNLISQMQGKIKVDSEVIDLIKLR